MKNTYLLVAVFGLITVSASAAEPVATTEKPNPNRFGLSYRPGFNIKANFQNLGLGASAPGAAAGGVTHTYDDGFVAVDISGNAGGQTWFWGYANASQVAGPNLVFSSSQPGSLGSAVSDDPQHGFEFTYARELARGRRLRFGLESAFNFTDLKLRSQTAGTAGLLTMDAYSLGGIIPPLAPYSGTFAGPGPLISDAPTRSQVGVDSKFSASLYGFRFGPYLEIPFTKRLSLSLSGGVAAGYVEGDFRYEQSATVAGSGAFTSSAMGNKARWLAGGYVGGNLVFKLGKSVDLFAGAQFQSLGQHTQTLGDKQVNLDLRESLFATCGLGYSF